MSCSIRNQELGSPDKAVKDESMDKNGKCRRNDGNATKLIVIAIVKKLNARHDSRSAIQMGRHGLYTCKSSKLK